MDHRRVCSRCIHCHLDPRFFRLYLSLYRAFYHDKTLYIKKGKGGKIWDLDDNEYIDYRLAYGPIILGYQDERVDEAARSGMDIGGVFALATELEYEIAERINKMVKSAELVRFSNSGTEAVMAALRVARAYTGKDGHVILEGGYHGVFSEVMWYSEIEDWDPKTGNPDLLPFGEGIPKVTKKLNYTVHCIIELLCNFGYPLPKWQKIWITGFWIPVFNL